MSTLEAQERAWVEVNLDHLIENARTIQRAAPSARLLPMVKANAYGTGVRQVVGALDRLDPWGYGVGTVQEGIELREFGERRPIVVFTPTRVEQLSHCERHQLRPVLDDPRAIAQCKGPFHIEVDTGMGRVGIPWRRAGEIIAGLPRVPEGILTHFHSADEHPATVAQQLARFDQVINSLPERPEFVHVANSAAVFRLKHAHDLVRPGLFLYGGAVGNDTPRPQPVLSLRSRVVSIRQLQPGDTVSYGATWTAAALTHVATLGVGYADGVPRVYGGRGSVVVEGRHCPVVGRVTMDMTMVDIGSQPNSSVDLGSVATLIGNDGGEEITLDTFAEWAGMSSYEALVGISGRVPRTHQG